MDYYIVGELSGVIVDVYGYRPSQADLDKIAQDVRESVYVIEGQHNGLSADYEPESGE